MYESACAHAPTGLGGFGTNRTCAACVIIPAAAPRADPPSHPTWDGLKGDEGSIRTKVNTYISVMNKVCRVCIRGDGANGVALYLRFPASLHALIYRISRSTLLLPGRPRQKKKSRLLCGTKVGANVHDSTRFRGRRLAVAQQTDGSQSKSVPSETGRCRSDLTAGLSLTQDFR
jgi:hypothetical protein